MTRFSFALTAAAVVVGLSAPAFAEMGPDMTCVDFEMLRVGDNVLGQQDATKVLKAAAAAAGTLPAELANTESVVGLAEAIASRCSTQPNMLAMDAMLDGNYASDPVRGQLTGQGGTGPAGAALANVNTLRAGSGPWTAPGRRWTPSDGPALRCRLPFRLCEGAGSWLTISG